MVSSVDRPVFVVAPHRSGTTILCRLLAATGAFNVVTAFHVLNRRRLRDLGAAGGVEAAKRELQRRFEAERIVDEYGLPVTADHPEEYAYALDRQGRRPVLSPANLAGFRAFCADVQAVEAAGRPLLLKNPFDTANFLFVAGAVPDARFVLLHRNPLEVIDSQIRLIRWMLRTRSPYDALIVARYRRLWASAARRTAARLACAERLPILFELVLRNVARGCDYTVRHADRLDGRAVSLTYPDLCRDPETEIRRVLRFLRLPEEGARGCARLVAPRRPGLTAEVERRRRRVERRTAAYRAAFGV